jgi:hypothetical protein
MHATHSEKKQKTTTTTTTTTRSTKLIVVVKHIGHRLFLVKRVLQQTQDLFEECELMPPRRFMKLMRSSHKKDFERVRVWFFDSITDINKVTKPKLFQEYYQLLNALNVVTSPRSIKTMKMFEKKEYALDTNHLMLPGTIVTDGSETSIKTWEKVLYRRSIRMKSGLMNGGAGQCVVRNFEGFDKYLTKQFAEGGQETKIVLCQRNIRPFREIRMLVLPDGTILPGEGDSVPDIAETIVKEIVPILFKQTNGVPEFPWILDLVEWKGKYYLNEAQYCAAGAGMWKWTENIMLSQVLADCFKATLLIPNRFQ